MRNVRIPISAPAVLCNDLCRERICSTSHLCRPAVDTALDDVLGTKQPAKPQEAPAASGNEAIDDLKRKLDKLQSQLAELSKKSS